MAPTMTQDIELSRNQLDIIDKVMAMNTGFLFVTGDAGTGKSTVLRIVRGMRKSLVCAPTGLAGINVGGPTIHSLFGIKPNETYRGPSDKQKQIIRAAEILIIDEVSMVSSELMSQIDLALKKAWNNDQWFGGMPVVAFGDLAQLEPVVADDEVKKYLDETYGSHFFFDAHCIKENMFFDVAPMTQIFRQSNPDYIEALNHVRHGRPDRLDVFNAQCGNRAGDGSVKVTFTNKRAAEINKHELGKINSESRWFSGYLSGTFGDRELPVEKDIELKVGARVMLVTNSQRENAVWVNGSMGVVTDIASASKQVTVRLDNGNIAFVGTNKWERVAYTYDPEEGLQMEIIGEFSQLPIKLAYAVTAHKSQGQTYDSAHLELERKAFAHGQLYVALSRCRTLEGMTIGRHLDRSDLAVNPRVTEWLESNGI